MNHFDKKDEGRFPRLIGLILYASALSLSILPSYGKNALTSPSTDSPVTVDSTGPAGPPFDVFPLAKGTKFTFSYYSDLWDVGYSFALDSGVVSYTVGDSVQINDSTRLWKVTEVVHLTQIRRTMIAYVWYVSSTVLDTSITKDFAESLSGNHDLKFDGWVWSFPVPDSVLVSGHFSIWDTALTIARYSQSLSPTVAMYYSNYGAETISDTLKFKAGVGLLTRTKFTGGFAMSALVGHTVIALIGLPTALHQNTIVDRSPNAFSLDQNYPNPFNPSTTIRYSLPQRSHVTLAVYNTLGQLVCSLVNGEEEPGYHEVKFDGAGLASGVYFHRLQGGSFVKTMKLVILQ